MGKNYYKILGILPTATPRDVRDAYRRSAKELHPDHYGENSSPFLEVQEAYGVLSDPDHRSRYDRRVLASRIHPAAGKFSYIEPLKPNRPAAEPLRATEEPFAYETIDLRNSFRSHRPSMEEIFDRIRDNFKPAAAYKSERLQNLSLEIILTPDEARMGGQFRISVPTVSPCPTCGGRGIVPPYQCYRCMGAGSVSDDLPVDIKIAPGIPDGFQKAISLRRFGIRDVYLTLLFRVSSSEYPEDL
jgi:molecular chaperone DnaJ